MAMISLDSLPYHNIFSTLILKTQLDPFLFFRFRNCQQFVFHLDANFLSSNKYEIVLC